MLALRGTRLSGKGDGIAIRALGWLLHLLTVRLALHASGVLYVTQTVLQKSFPTKGLSVAVSNELAIIFNRMQIDTQAVLEAAGRNGTSCHSVLVWSGGIASAWTPIT